jgi:hypothetical protein
MMAGEMNRYPVIDPELTWRLLDGDAVIVSPASGEIRVLNHVGTEIWQLLANGRSPAHIQQTIATQYNLPPTQAAQDLDAFLDDLAARGLITWQTPVS